MVEMYDCPDCAFSYDMAHRVDRKGNVYPCPCCAEARLEKENEGLRSAVVSLADAAELLHKEMHIIQPFLAVFKAYGATIEAARSPVSPNLTTE